MLVIQQLLDPKYGMIREGLEKKFINSANNAEKFQEILIFYPIER